MKKILNIYALLFFCSLSLVYVSCEKNNEGSISGTVTDSITNQPINGVTISIVSLSENTTANLPNRGAANTEKIIQSSKSGSNGIYSLSETRVGDVTVTFSRKGYNTVKKTVFVTVDKTTSLNVSLGPAKPVIVTGQVSNANNTSATVSANLKDVGYNGVTQYGHCWSYTNGNPTITNCHGKTTKGAISDSLKFTSQLTGLVENKLYYVRAYATNKAGTVYGNVITFRSLTIDVSDGLIAFYPLDGDYFDYSGQANRLYTDWGLWPPFVPDRFGRPGSACRFYYQSDLYTTNKFSELNDVSASLWFYKTSWENEDQRLFMIGENTQIRFYISQGASPNNFYCGVRINNVEYRVTLDQWPSADVWHHVAAVRNGTSLSFYIDGVNKGTVVCPSGVLPYTTFTDVGCGFMTSGYKEFRGMLDEIRVYNRALNTSEIQFLSSH